MGPNPWARRVLSDLPTGGAPTPANRVSAYGHHEAVDILLGTFLTAATFALLVAGYRSPALIVAAVSVVLLVAVAETPFGIGDGTMPEVVGLGECAATERLRERGLRWRFGPRSPVGGRPASCVDPGLFSVSDEVLGQRPQAGKKLGESEVVVLETACTREPSCSRIGRYTYGLR